MDDFLSYPDPLNDVPPNHSPTKPRVNTRPRYSFPLEGSSPTKQTFELDVGNQISPQKIRVTVEAGASDIENPYTHTVQRGRASPTPARRPANRRRERTTTTTVPVKGLSDSDSEEVATPKRGRGRPRKSSGTPVPAKKRGRAITPTQKTKTGRKSINTSVNDDLHEGDELILGEGVELGRGKGRSRSRSTKGRSRNSTPAGHASTEPSDKAASRSTSRKSRGRRKEIAPEEILVLEDESSGSLANNEAQGGSGPDNILSSTDTNGPNVPSAYSTIRSTTTAGQSEPDITIARFDGMGPPVQTGWSSPRIIKAPHVSKSNRGARKKPSSNLPSRNTPKPDEDEDSIDLILVSPERSARTRDDRDLSDDVEDQGNIGVVEYHEFDTILESEGFSMISVDSVPSLRDQISSSVNHEGEEELPTPIKNKAVRAVQSLEPAGEGDSFSSIPEDVLEAATPGRRTSSNTLLVPVTRINDSFSSIPPEILEAATPARPFGKTKTSKFLATVNADMNDSFSSIAPEILEAATPGRELKTTPAPMHSQERGSYQYSLSAIPSVLPVQADEDPERLFARGSIQQNDQGSTSRRLPTPEDTPPPLGDMSGTQSTEPPNDLSIAPAVTSGNDSLLLSQIRSSPPSIAPRRYTYTAHLRQQRDLYPDKTQTPSIVFSSPTLPPPIQFLNGRPTFTSQLAQPERPKLSTTINAGRALQGIVVPLSPRVRAHSLGSPFKSPLVERNASSSVSLDPSGSPTQSRRARPLPKLDLAGNISSEQSKQSIWDNTVRHDDPFSNSVALQQRSPSPEEKQGYSLGLPDKRRISDLRLFGSRTDNHSIRSDDAMSWQAEEEISLSKTSIPETNPANPASTQGSSRVSGADHTVSSEQRWANERDAVKRQVETANDDKIIVIDSDDEQPSEVNGDEDAEFGLLLETLNSSSPAVPAQPKSTNAEKPRRSKIPSPWRKNSKRLVYNDELSHLSISPVDTQELLGNIVVKETEAEAEMDLSEFIIPQKAGFKPRIRERATLDLSALLASSPNKAPLPVLSKFTQDASSAYQMSRLDDAPTLTKPSNDSSQSPSQGFVPIPQKLDFTPRIRDRSLSGGSMLFSSTAKQRSVANANGIFGTKFNENTLDRLTPELTSSSSDLQPLGLSSPSRNNTLSVPNQKHAVDQISPPLGSFTLNPKAIASHEEKENMSIENRTLKWTETVSLASVAVPSFVSPTKSCLRTPLKLLASGAMSNPSPSKNVAFVSSSPIPSSPITKRLSATRWSRDHWTLLDSILQNWKPESQREGEERRRRNSTRVISKLLGKNVNFDGEKMKLQQWHLEVVDEFRGHVDGWQEADIAKRVFALLVGEEKRGLVKSGHANLTRKQVV